MKIPPITLFRRSLIPNQYSFHRNLPVVLIYNTFHFTVICDFIGFPLLSFMSRHRSVVD